MLFKSKDDAVKSCEIGFEYSWHEFATSNKLFEKFEPKIVDAQKLIFRAGYMNGVKFMSNSLINTSLNKPKE